MKNLICNKTLQAVFWAIYKNQPRCLELLLNKSARLNIVDMSNRSPQSICNSYNYKEIQHIIAKYVQDDETDETDLCCDVLQDISTWHDYYPGLRDENKYVFFFF